MQRNLPKVVVSWRVVTVCVVPSVVVVSEAVASAVVRIMVVA